jgi:exodeoxyribonuclease V alpha subunit
LLQHPSDGAAVTDLDPAAPTAVIVPAVATARPDRYDGRVVTGLPAPLDVFNAALVLTAADVHVALRLGLLTGEDDPLVLLAAALAVRAPRIGHVCVDLATVAATTVSDAEEGVDVGNLPWPDVAAWVARIASSPMVAAGDPAAGPDGTGPRPLRLEGRLLYLDRYWAQERLVAADIAARNEPAPADIDLLADGLIRLFGPAAGPQAAGPQTAADETTPPDDNGSDLQRLAAAVAVLRRLAVVAGGPGTGKTTTVARLVALLDEQGRAGGGPPPKIALAAPTGKAAARLQEGVHAEAAGLDVGPETRERLLGLRASTIHRLLGTRPDSQSRFRHDRTNRLPFDAVIIDETSMVALPMMARLMEALRPDARLVLLGDPDQLSSVEAGAVLGDIVGPAVDRPVMSEPARGAAAAATGQPAAAGQDVAGGHDVGDAIVVLRRVHRYGGGIADLAAAVRKGDGDATVAALRAHPDSVTWHRHDGPLDDLQATWAAAGQAVTAAAREGDGRGALAALGAFRLLCAHRRGPDGVTTWMERVEGWLGYEAAGPARGRWYLGRPVLVTRNDYGLNLSNGDIGVVVAGEAGYPAVAFLRAGEVVLIAPTRLEAVETAYAMTIHKSQGSQFDRVAVVLPDPDSRILTRELLYTALTRARRHVHVIGDEDRVRAAVEREVARASGLRARLWGAQG